MVHQRLPGHIGQARRIQTPGEQEKNFSIITFSNDAEIVPHTCPELGFHNLVFEAVFAAFEAVSVRKIGLGLAFEAQDPFDICSSFYGLGCARLALTIALIVV